ncbi:gluconokinase [Mesorhizobium sp. RMAD-H1]|uniref:gluconokinase n=1 Tax=Mesorhizobium sp. RMAD-H1 TaxID=2587065 RepID=UPI00183CA68A|nr:gluconokinase [Mesorhizobium sp. RMAD-H1]MBB2973156.1 gluconokinase [Mesorhizobium sp. RMAD-H1]
MHRPAKNGDKPIALIVMGPSGVGKTTTAELISQKLGWTFAEGDTFHPPANIEKMSAGIPLDDTDRAPWLEKIRDWISDEASAGRNVVITCSALKRIYRETLREAKADVRFVELVADPNLVAERMAHRKGHFMPASLLASQFATLEDLHEDENGVKVAVDAPPERVVERALVALGLDTPAKR